jgi:hypothetical protein
LDGIAWTDLSGFLSLTDGFFEDFEGADCVFASGHGRISEHDFVVRPVFGGEAYIGYGHGVEGWAYRLLAGGFERVSELLEACLADCAEQIRFVGEMAVGGGAGNSRAGSDLPQCKGAYSLFFNQFQACVDEGGAKVSMMVSAH